MILVVGLLLAMSFFSKDEGTGHFKQQGILTLIITAILSIFIIVIATAKLWYTHLWKKNSTHARHKQHTQYHPTMRDKELKKRHNRR